MTSLAPALFSLQHICKSFTKPNQQPLQVLDNVSLELYPGQIVALLGKSGSGKSTLLRIMAGLTRPTEGHVFFKGQPISEPIREVQLLFQQVALMPWLTVLENVELGLQAQGVPRDISRQRALQAIDLIGLDGFESAYPRELSGGMQSRVGFARALVINPDILLMDELFSTLDILTAENLRSDLMDLWQASQTPLKAILMVTHNIEQAALMADRILVFSSDPGRIRGELIVDLPQPRHERDPRVREVVDDIYALMTSEEKLYRPTTSFYRHKVISLGYRLPQVDISSLMGLLEEVIHANKNGPMELQDLAESLNLDVDSLFPSLDLLDILQLGRVVSGALELTREGTALGKAAIHQKKEIFSAHLLAYVPLVKTIRDTLHQSANHCAPEETFIDLLQSDLSPEEAHRVLMTVIEWGRYAEIFAYHAKSRLLSLENPD